MSSRHSVSAVSPGRRSGSSLLQRLSSFWMRVWQCLECWSERRRQRRALHRLDDRTLRDIGLSRADVEREAGKPFWRS